MSRLPSFFVDMYLDERHDADRLSGAPADLARLCDAAAPASQGYELRGTVLQLASPKALCDAVGHVAVSIVPAALDELLRRDEEDRDSYFLDPFALLVVNAEPGELAALVEPLRDIVRAALLDHFEAIGAEHDLEGITPQLEAEVEQILDETALRVELCPVAFCFEPGGTPRGERLLGHLFDERSRSFEPAPWASRIAL